MPENPSTIDRLRGLLEVTRLVRAETEQSALLDAIATSIATSLGFHTVVINLYRPAWNDFEVTTVHGSDDARRALLGDTLDWAAWAPLLDERFERRGTYLIPHGAFDWEGDVGRRYVPAWEPSADPEAWHPDDELFVPMLHSDGHTLGILSVGEPYTGRRPSDEELEVLVAVADHVALALQSFQEEAAAAHHRIALRGAPAGVVAARRDPAVEAILQATCDGIGRARVRVSIQLPDTGSGVFVTRDGRLDDRRVAQNMPLSMWARAPSTAFSRGLLLPYEQRCRAFRPAIACRSVRTAAAVGLGPAQPSSAPRPRGGDRRRLGRRPQDRLAVAAAHAGLRVSPTRPPRRSTRPGASRRSDSLRSTIR
jgi:GAF domain-containing protein